MAVKIIACALLAALAINCCTAAVVPVVPAYPAPVYHAPVAPVYKPAPHPEPAYPPPHYTFAYDVKDEHTGDIHAQEEANEAGAVKGSYTLVQPDGQRRIVEYTADDHTGFLAVVKYEPYGPPLPPPPPPPKPVVPVVPVVKYAAPVVPVVKAYPYHK